MSQSAHIQLCHAPGQAGDKLRLRSWIEVQLVGEDDAPIPGEAYEITLPGGSVVAGTLDEKGCARVGGIPAGVCLVTFKNLDRDAWAPLEESKSKEASAA